MMQSFMPNQIFIDTGFFKALVDASDNFHQQAKKIWKKLEEKKASFVTSNFIIDETFTVIRIKCGLKKATIFRDLLVENSQVMHIVRVTVADESGAWQWFVKNWGKLSFTDCVSFAVMKRLGLMHAATFDEHFQRAGFTVEK